MATTNYSWDQPTVGGDEDTWGTELNTTLEAIDTDLKAVADGAKVGTTTNDNAPAGEIGEYVSSSVASGSAVSLTSNAAANITSIELTAGDWDVGGNVVFSSGGGTLTDMIGWISTASATLPTPPGDGGYARVNLPGAGLGSGIALGIPPRRVSIATTTTVYLSGRMSFSGGSSNSAFGFIGARRAR